MKIVVLGASKHKGDYEGTPYDYSRIYTYAPMEQSEDKKGQAGVDMRCIPDVFPTIKDADFSRGLTCEVVTELRAMGGGKARETVVSVTPVKG